MDEEDHSRGEFPELTEAQGKELLRRSQAHRRDPAEAIPLEATLISVERMLRDRENTERQPD